MSKSTGSNMPQGSRRVSSAQELHEVLQKLDHEIVLAVEGTKVVQVMNAERHTLCEDEDLEIRQYSQSNLASSVQEQLEPAIEQTPSVYIMLCGSTVVSLSRKTIVLKNGPRLFVAVVCGKFLEFHLSADEDTVEDEEVELLESMLKDNAELRVKGVKPPKGRVPVHLTEGGKLLEDGVGDMIGKEVRSGAHFLAKRVTEKRVDVLNGVRGLSKAGKSVLRECPPGSELRIKQGTLDNLRRAGLVVNNAAGSISEGGKGMLRGVSKQVGCAVGDEVHESPLGQQMVKHRGLREARRIVLATVDASDELFTSAAGVPHQLLKAVADAIIDVVGHVWGDQAAEGATYSFSILVDFLATKWAIEWAFPSSLALHGLKSVLRAACDNPSNKALEHMENKRQRYKMEDETRAMVLERMGKEQ